MIGILYAGVKNFIELENYIDFVEKTILGRLAPLDVLSYLVIRKQYRGIFQFLVIFFLS